MTHGIGRDVGLWVGQGGVGRSQSQGPAFRAPWKLHFLGT